MAARLIDSEFRGSFFRHELMKEVFSVVGGRKTIYIECNYLKRCCLGYRNDKKNSFRQLKVWTYKKKQKGRI